MEGGRSAQLVMYKVIGDFEFLGGEITQGPATQKVESRTRVDWMRAGLKPAFSRISIRKTMVWRGKIKPTDTSTCPRAFEVV